LSFFFSSSAAVFSSLVSFSLRVTGAVTCKQTQATNGKNALNKKNEKEK
jgi:hypothetical protein